ncbi:energy transducer TonB [Saccharicrinis sp. FJH62]|uniref:energy transducer TonB n=1 Tax=Saccharicrinis sp. FJH62 TaxID=3344657 RepID=UPI0035D46D8F
MNNFRKILLSLLFIISVTYFTPSMAQDFLQIYKNGKADTIFMTKDYQINVLVPQMPKYKNQDYNLSFVKYLKKKIDKTKGVKKRDLNKRVYVAFVVNADSTISHIFFPKSSGSELLDKSIINAVQESAEDWTPGTNNDTNANVLLTIIVGLK